MEKRFNKKKFLLLISSIVLVIALVITAFLLFTNENNPKTFSGTILNTVYRIRENLNIIEWDSHEQDPMNTEYHPAQSTVPSAYADCGSCILVDNSFAEAFDSPADGWNAINTTYKDTNNVTFILCQDWKSTSDYQGFDENKTGVGFGGEGGLLIENRKKGSTLTIDLNGYKLDRFLVMVSPHCGEVIRIGDTNSTVIIQNGYITGGATADTGGAINCIGKNVKLSLINMTISGNVSGSYGGGIYVSNSVSQITLDNTTISGNYAEGYGGGFYIDSEGVSADAANIYRINVQNKVIIKDNIGADSRNNLTLYAYDGPHAAGFNNLEGLTEGSEIYLSLTRVDEYVRVICNHNNLHSPEFGQYLKIDSSSNWKIHGRWSTMTLYLYEIKRYDACG